MSAPHRGARRCGLPAALVTGLLVAGLLVTGCGINNDSSPRKVVESARSPLVAPAVQVAGAATGSDRIYLLAPDSSTEARRLRASTRDVGDSPTERLQSLFGARTVAETTARLRTALPDGIQLRSAQVRTDGVLAVDVTDELLALPRSSLVDAVAQIVFTAAEVPGVRSVELRVDSQSLPWPTGDGELQNKPLTVYDYPGFVESTQPNFPQVPSPADS